LTGRIQDDKDCGKKRNNTGENPWGPAHRRAFTAAAEETELKTNTLPQSCPWTMEQILDEDLWPV